MVTYTTAEFLSEIQRKNALLQLCHVGPDGVVPFWLGLCHSIRENFSAKEPKSIYIKDTVTFHASGTVKFAPAFLNANGLKARPPRAAPWAVPQTPVSALNRRASTPAKTAGPPYRELGSQIGIGSTDAETLTKHMLAHLGEQMRVADRRVTVDMEGLGTIFAMHGIVDFLWFGSERAGSSFGSVRGATPMGATRPSSQARADEVPQNVPATPVDDLVASEMAKLDSLRCDSRPSSRAARPPSRGHVAPLTDVAGSRSGGGTELRRAGTPGPRHNQLPPMAPGPHHQPHSQQGHHHHHHHHTSLGSLSGDSLRAMGANTSMSLSRGIYASTSPVKGPNQQSLDLVMDLAMQRHNLSQQRDMEEKMRDVRRTRAEQELHRRIVHLEYTRKKQSQKETQAVLEKQMAELREKNKKEPHGAQQTSFMDRPLPDVSEVRAKVRADQLALRTALDEQVRQRRDEVEQIRSQSRVQENEAIRRVLDEMEAEKDDVHTKQQHMKRVLADAWEAQIQLERAKHVQSTMI
eukprot:PhM_4_TR5914/c0_g1_i1/m.61871